MCAKSASVKLDTNGKMQANIWSSQKVTGNTPAYTLPRKEVAEQICHVETVSSLHEARYVLCHTSGRSIKVSLMAQAVDYIL